MDDQSPVVKMDEHFDVDEAMEALSRQRYAMPPVAIAAFRQAALKGSIKLLKIVEGEEFDKMSTRDKLAVLEMIFDRAYGKAETASTSAITAHKTGEGTQQNSDHGKQLAAIEARMAARKQRYPELEKAAAVVPEVRKQEAHAAIEHVRRVASDPVKNPVRDISNRAVTRPPLRAIDGAA
jgi:hypothetical protein